MNRPRALLGRRTALALLASFLLPACASGMAKVRGGEFLMGSADPAAPTSEMPRHPLEVDSFRIGVHEVTNREFKEFLDATGYRPADPAGFLEHWVEGTYPPQLAEHPVVHVNYFDAEAYLEWVGGRLPTEAEWEKAATWDEGESEKTAFPWGNEYDASRAQVESTSTAPVGSHPRGHTPEGLADLYGNVWEWTSSWFEPYPENMDGNPHYGARFRVVRGGSYHAGEVIFTCLTRNPKEPTTRSPLIGFRQFR